MVRCLLWFIFCFGVAFELWFCLCGVGLIKFLLWVVILVSVFGFVGCLLVLF